MLKRRERRDFCPICGVRVRRRHRCDPKFLQRRDALMKMERVEGSGLRITTSRYLVLVWNLVLCCCLTTMMTMGDRGRDLLLPLSRFHLVTPLATG